MNNFSGLFFIPVKPSNCSNPYISIAVSCNANDGQVIIDDKVILNNIWNLFNSSDVSNNSALKKRNGNLLKYYGNPSTTIDNSYEMILDPNSSGQCYAFSFLFIDFSDFNLLTRKIFVFY